ncbi:MAG: glycosyltransferase [Candidatus Aenigmarchaeota archaeon]|nr:glycosyltransferase [Candidatus Aenigmarchaeota archaeon]
MRVAVLHDFFDKTGGGERVAIALTRMFGADLYTGFVENEKTYSLDGINVKSLMDRPPRLAYSRNTKLSRLFEKLDIKYDLYIFSGTWCMSAAGRLKPNMLYMHTPPRFLYDLNGYFESGMNPITRLFFRRFCKRYMALDQSAVREFGSIAVNSRNTMNRVMKYYGPDVYKKCSIVNPPVDTRRFRNRKSEDFYLSTSRLDRLKRIDTVINAFIENGRRLVIASTGPDEKRLKEMATGHDSIEFTGSLGENELTDLYSRCRATIAAAKDEDFGLVAVESMASGKPCIAVNEGGFTETIMEGRTGLLFHPDKDSLNSAIDKSERLKWNAASLMKESGKYDTLQFERKMKNMAKKLLR